MGAASRALIVAVLVAFAPPAHADSCTGISPRGSRFATCFDPGNRLSLTAATTGLGGSLELRHDITFDDEPDLIWKMEHLITQASYTPFGDHFEGLLYRGRYLRHSRDGHIMLPIGAAARKVFLPFDVGALVEVGSLEWRANDNAQLGIVKTAALIDISRARDHRARLAFGPVGSWGVELSRAPVAISEHEVAPFSALLVEGHVESNDGLWIGDARTETGMVWHTTRGWILQERAEASLEKTLIAINDRPVAMFAAVRYDSALSDTTAMLGLRFVLVDRTDPRVSRLGPANVTAAAGPSSPSE